VGFQDEIRKFVQVYGLVWHDDDWERLARAEARTGGVWCFARVTALKRGVNGMVGVLLFVSSLLQRGVNRMLGSVLFVLTPYFSKVLPDKTKHSTRALAW